MKISIIVPVYNVEKYIGKCLDTIVNQDFHDYEVIVVIDGSTDDSESIVREYQKKYPEIIKIICQENKGLGGARNTGIMSAKGEYLVFVDSDDMLYPNILHDVYEKAIASDADIVVFDMEFVDEEGNNIKYESAKFRESVLIDFNENSKIIAWPSAWNKLCKKSLFVDKEIYYPERLWFEDLATTPKVMLEAEKIEYIPKAYYKYVQREGSIMNNKKIERNREVIEAFETTVDYIKKNRTYNQWVEELEFLAIYHILYTAVLRINELDSSSKLQKELVEYVRKHYPKYNNNKYLNELMSKKEKIVITLIGKKMFKALRLMFKVNRIFGDKNAK